MGRWEPNARGRLEKAALELYAERGFDAVTVAEIAARAGLTERTFFRHFADKREVLFGGSEHLEEHLVKDTASAPQDLGPVEAIALALTEMADAVFVGERIALARNRQAVIDAHPDLRERELIKMASLSSALAGALRERGVGDPGAGLAAEAGVAIFKVAFERWIADSGPRPLAEFIREAADAMRDVAGS
ncbi:MAG: TetR family transcriptional regulator [Nocardiopsaceae bacterium]|nr:TetR family transcriptional regulator [Nocardiopsaceae bacterium]